MFKRILCFTFERIVLSAFYIKVYPNLNNNPELLETKSKGDIIEEMKYKTEKHDHENRLKSRKIDDENYKKKYINLN